MDSELIILMAVRHLPIVPQALFDLFVERLGDENPFMSRNDFDCELSNTIEGGLIIQEDGLLKTTDKGRKFLKESRILAFILEVKKNSL